MITCRENEAKDPRPKIIDLHEVQSLGDMDHFGDYYWDTLFEKISSLVLSCPFCGKTAPMPTLTSVESIRPLTLTQDLTCGNCGQGFRVIKGQAIKMEIGSANE